jgi:hypothetical protein
MRMLGRSLSWRYTWIRHRLSRRELRSATVVAAVWLVPVLAIWTIYFSPKHVISATSAITYLIALGVLLLAMRRPDRSLLILIVVFPFQGLLLAKLFALGVPGSVVRHMGAWKETLALAVVFCGVRSLVSSGRRLDALDKLALGFVAVTAIYAVFQTTIVPGSPSASNIRLLGFRETAGFVLLLFGARHAPLGEDFPRRAARALFLVGTLVAVVGIFEALDSSAWNHFIVKTIQYPSYQTAVLGSAPANPNDIRIYASNGTVRIGSVFLDELALAWYLLLPLAIGVERVVRGRASAFDVLATAAIAAALLLTQTRSAIIGAAIVVLLSLPYAAGRGRHWRVRASLVISAVAMLAIPGAFATGVARRIENTTKKNNQDTAGHVGGFWGGIDTMGQNPLGLGLGTGAGTGQRFNVATDIIPENNYLEVGDELGIGPMLLFAVLTLTLLVWLGRAARRRAPPLVTAAWTAGIGLAVAAWFLQTWSSYPVAWTYWGLAGAMLTSARQRASVPAPSATDRRQLATYPALPEQAVSSASR